MTRSVTSFAPARSTNYTTRRCLVVGTPSGAVLIAAAGDEVVALDNRCPHMGFPLHRGSIEDGILTCHWHHARFDLRSGSTFDLWADDVPLRDVRIVEGEIWVAAKPTSRAEAAHWRQRLHDGLAHNINLVIAKALLGAMAAGVPATELVCDALLYGAAHRDRWGSGLTTLMAVADLLPVLDDEDRFLALFHGITAGSLTTATESRHGSTASRSEEMSRLRRLRGGSGIGCGYGTAAARTGRCAQQSLRAPLRNGSQRPRWSPSPTVISPMEAMRSISSTKPLRGSISSAGSAPTLYCRPSSLC